VDNMMAEGWVWFKLKHQRCGMQQPGATPQVTCRQPPGGEGATYNCPILLSSTLPRLQRFDHNSIVTWGVDPGFYITRFWR